MLKSARSVFVNRVSLFLLSFSIFKFIAPILKIQLKSPLVKLPWTLVIIIVIEFKFQGSLIFSSLLNDATWAFNIFEYHYGSAWRRLTF